MDFFQACSRTCLFRRKNALNDRTLRIIKGCVNFISCSQGVVNCKSQVSRKHFLTENFKNLADDYEIIEENSISHNHQKSTQLISDNDNNQVIPRLRTFFPIHIHNKFQLLIFLFQRLNLLKFHSENMNGNPDTVQSCKSLASDHRRAILPCFSSENGRFLHLGSYM